jgi:hypothetical protein
MATFITSKSVGQMIGIWGITTSTGYWKYYHNGTYSSVFANSFQVITVANANGEFTIIPCLSDGTPSGDITYLNLSSNQLTSFDGTGLTSLSQLVINGDNQLTSIDVSPLTNLNNLSVNDNLLDSVDNDLILSQLVANGRNDGIATTSGGRTSAGTNDFMTLQSRGWNLQGFNLPVVGNGKLRVKGVGQL